MEGTSQVPETSGALEDQHFAMLWTFSSDGTLQGSDWYEDASGYGGTPPVPFVGSFSHQQGTWKETSPGVAKLVFLDIEKDNTGASTGTARVDGNITFASDCSTATSTNRELRFFNGTADPLDLTATSLTIPLSDVSGRLVTVP